MELLSDIWDKTTDAFTALTEGVSEGLVRLFGSSNERQNPADAGDGGSDRRARAGDAGASADELRAKTVELRERGKPVRRLRPFYPRRSPLRGSQAAAISTCVTSTFS